MPENLTGKIIQGQYKIIRQLGVGGFGTTYLAEDLNIPINPQPKRVIKKLHSRDDEIVFRYTVTKFEKEAQTLYCLGEKYNFIPKLFAYFNQGNELYLVQELIEGNALIREMIPGNPWSEINVFNFLQEILAKLALVHQEKIIHRDLKPSNIIRNHDGKLFLIDFGAVKEASNTELQKTSVGIGTRGYMPREQIFGKPKFSSDIYAVGIIAIQALTGIPACDLPEDDNEEIVWQNLVSISHSLAEILTKMVRSDYRYRYKNVPEVLADLDAIENEIELSQTELYLKEQDTLISLAKTELRSIALPTTELYLKTFSFEVVKVNSYGEIIDRTNKRANYFTEDLGNDVTLDMVAIPGGNFIMGAPETEIGSTDKERPQHRVTVSPFYMGKFPVTQAQWRQVASLPKINIDLDLDPSIFKGNNLPVERINWYEAKEFCQRLSQKTRKQYRLPSEAEWEYACRAGTTTPFYFGETITTDLANYRGEDYTLSDLSKYRSDDIDEEIDAVFEAIRNGEVFDSTMVSCSYGNGPKGEYREKSTPVGIFPPNAFGLYDMHGNVSEFCEDPWHDNYEGAPTDGSVWWEGASDDRSVLRGGSYSQRPSECTCTRRKFNPVKSSIIGDTYDGFRVVCIPGKN